MIVGELVIASEACNFREVNTERAAESIHTLRSTATVTPAARRRVLACARSSLCVCLQLSKVVWVEP